MAGNISRSRKVAVQLQQELAQILQRDVKDPRIGMVNVTEVDLSRDLSHAKVYVTFFEEDAELIKVKLDALNSAKAYIRSLIAGKMQLRIVPSLSFFFDNSLSEGIRMTTLVNKVIAKDKEKEAFYTSKTCNDIDTELE